MVGNYESKKGTCMSWQTPKTNWSDTDRFNIQDFNRIKNNLSMVLALLSCLYDDVEYEDMGEDADAYSSYWSVEDFNLIEENVEIVGKHTDGVNPYKLTFYPNGNFIKYDELNRIEGLTAMYSDQVKGWIAGQTKLPLVCGRNRRLGF